MNKNCNVIGCHVNRSYLAGTIKVVCTNPAETLIAVGFSSGVVSLLESRTGMLVGSWKAGDTDIIHVSNYLIETFKAGSNLI